MRRATWGRLAALAALLVAAYAGLILWARGPEVLARARTLPGGALVAALAFSSAAFALRAMRWRLYLLRLREAPPFAVGFASGVASGKMGIVAKSLYLRELWGLPLTALVPATFAERLADTVSVALLLVVGLLSAPGVDARLALEAAALVALLPFALRSRLVARLARALDARFPRRHLASGWEHLRAALHVRALAAPAAVGLAAYLVESLALVAVAGGLGLALAPGEAALLVALADLAGVLSLIPGGVGAAEATLAALLLARGATRADAATLTLLYRAATLWWGSLLSALAVGALELARRRAASYKRSRGPRRAG